MILKIIATITIVVPFTKGVIVIWRNKGASTTSKIVETLTGIIPLIIGISETWKKKR